MAALCLKQAGGNRMPCWSRFAGNLWAQGCWIPRPRRTAFIVRDRFQEKTGIIKTDFSD
jgi:hypothetical protein